MNTTLLSVDDPAEHDDASIVEGPGFWALLGEQIVRGARAVGAGASAAVEAVDEDARRDLVQLPLVAMTLLGPRQPVIRPLADDGRRPVLFVHGLGGHPGNFLPMRGWLGLRGRRRGYSLGRPQGEDLMAYSRLLSKQIDTVLEVNGLGPDAQVDIVAHSMGGVIARLALLEVQNISRVRTLVTLGTPHAGTAAARFGGTECCKALRPDSETIAALSQQLPWRGPCRLVCLWSEADPLMQPAETAQVFGAENRRLVGVRHTDYLLRREVWREVHEALLG
jgi:triacylglycerol esterase/lipase EstA (alpha/beta hydrolase family)